MSRIIAVANQKGGVGKSTTVVNLAACLGKKGKKVLCVDIDAQGNTTSGFGINKRSAEITVYDVLLGQRRISDAIIKTEFKNVSVVSSTSQLAGADIELVDLENRSNRLKMQLLTIKNEFDYIFIDCPPSLGLLNTNALTAADSVMIPVQCEYFALEGLTQLLSTIRLIQKLWNPRLSIEGVLLTMFDVRTKLSVEVQQEVRKYFKEKVYRGYIPRNVRLSEAPSREESIFEYDTKSEGAKAYAAIVKEVLMQNERGGR